MKPLVYNQDLILASFYQSNGASNNAANDTWCVNGDSSNPTNLMVTLGASDTRIAIADKGIGPKTKCTWQF